MITTQINIKPHLAEYAIGSYGVYNKDNKFLYVRFPDNLDVYHTIWDLMVKRPDNCHVDSGNLKMCLPNRTEGKDPEYYNYLGKRSINIIERRLETMFFAEYRSRCEENKHRLGINYLDTAYEFLSKYCVDSITSDALIKDYYRYRVNVLKRNKTKRKYRKSAQKKE